MPEHDKGAVGGARGASAPEAPVGPASAAEPASPPEDAEAPATPDVDGPAGAPEAPIAASPSPRDVEEPAPDSAAEPAPAGGRVEHDLEELLARARERDEYLSLAQRTQADFENYRRRMAREVRAVETRGVTRLARELLPALDNLARALATVEGSGQDDGADRHLVDGIRLVHSELVGALGRVGIEPYSPQGERFDPQEHEAMAQHPVEGAEPGTVVEVYQQGYRIDGTILRPARVVVAA